MAAKIKILHAATATSTPPTLEEGVLAVNGLASPPELWTGVPTTRDPSGRINLLEDGGVTLPLGVADGGTGATTAAGARAALSVPMLVVGTVAPVTPAIGTLWFDTASLQMFIWFSDGTTSQWVPVISQPR